MSDPGKAVFLSYAREDTTAAQRIADALRTFGIEVWFDQSELGSGDAWEKKIRTEIKTCTLFLPIVSRQTEARSEGYFRREWKLAVDRTHEMGGNRSFIVPVVIDDTRESVADVPEEFLRYQWTRLTGGAPSPEFVVQVKRLLEPPKRVTVAPDATSAPVSPPEAIPPAVIFPGATEHAEPAARGQWGRFVNSGALVLGLSLAVVGIGAWLTRPTDQSRAAEPRHYELALPESAPVAFMGPAPMGIWQRAVAISRDGRTVAYIALKDGKTSLVARYLDTGGSREFPGTEGAYFPFFSPDGQWIAYFVKGDLRKVAAGGGSPSTIATDIRVPVGATWPAPDRILIAKRAGAEPIWVSPSDRTDTPIPNPGKQGQSSGSYTQDFEVLPGSEWAVGHFDYISLLSLKGAGDYCLSKNGPVRLGDAKLAETIRGYGPRYLKEGYLVFMSGQGTELQAMRFDPAKLQPAGPPFMVMEGIRRELVFGFGQCALSEQGTFVYAPGADAEISELVWVDSRGQREKVPIPAGLYHGLNLSRDGLAAFFHRKPTGERGDLVILELSTGRPVRSIPFERSVAIALSLWSPDGSLFVTPEHIFTGLDGQRTRQFASIRSSDFSTQQPEDFGQPLAISPNGEWVVSTTDLKRVTLRSWRDPKAPAVAIDSAGWSASFSPDSRWLAFTVYDSVNKIVVIPVPYDGKRRFEVASDEGDQPRWFPDGQRLAYKRGRQIMVIDLTFRGDRVDAAPPQVFVEGPFPRVSAWSYDIGPDGRVLTFANAEETSARQLKIITNFPELVRQKERQAAR